MKVYNYSNQNFKGYKNFLANDASIGNGYRFSFITMQLDNNGYDDLNRWQQLQNYYPSLKKTNDIVTLVYSKTPKRPPLFVLENTILATGDELALSRAACLGTSVEEEYLKTEKFTLKAYTLLADITKRIMNDSLLDRDAGIMNVIRNLQTTFTCLMGNDQKAAFEIINLSALKNMEPQKVAKVLNDKIAHTMTIFFK